MDSQDPSQSREADKVGIPITGTILAPTSNKSAEVTFSDLRTDGGEKHIPSPSGSLQPHPVEPNHEADNEHDPTAASTNSSFSTHPKIDYNSSSFEEDLQSRSRECRSARPPDGQEPSHFRGLLDSGTNRSLMAESFASRSGWRREMQDPKPDLLDVRGVGPLSSEVKGVIEMSFRLLTEKKGWREDFLVLADNDIRHNFDIIFSHRLSEAIKAEFACPRCSGRKDQA